MTNGLVGAAGDLTAKWTIDFKLPTTLSRPIKQPAIVDDPVGLAVFGDTAAIFLAEVADPGASPYSKLTTVAAKTYIHGWTVSAGWLYVIDGVELIGFELRTGNKATSKALLTGDDEGKALEALGKLQKAQQKVEWATLLEQAEEEWMRVTQEQAAAATGSAKRDELDKIAFDFFNMLQSLRDMTGGIAGGVAARKLVAELRAELATQRTAAAPWCFSPPVVRRRTFEEPQRSIFTVQGDGRLHTVDKSLTQTFTQKWKGQAELQVTLVEDLNSSLRLMAYVSEGTLRVVDAKTFAEVDFWEPATKPANSTTHTLSSVKGHVYWGTDSGVYACKIDDTTGKLTTVWSSGVPWTTRQVGRLNAPVTTYKPAVDPNELFDTMNVRTWTEQRADKTVPLSDGQMTLLALSDEAGKYTSPAAGKSHLVYGPFERDANSGESRWTQVKPHHSGSLVLLSDNRGASSFCRKPLASVSQLVPQWSVAPWLLSSITPFSALDQALAEGWPTAARRGIAKPKTEMVAWLNTTTVAQKVKDLSAVLSIIGLKPYEDQYLRLTLWHALFNIPHPPLHSSWFKDEKSILDTVYPASDQDKLKALFGQPGTQWESFSEAEYLRNVSAKTECQVNFDPPYVNKSIGANLFHATAPLWYDPWGFNRPGDFITAQPAKGYLDPFCFDGQLRVPHRRITFDTASKIRSWAVFTDNDPSTILRSVKPPRPDGTPAPEPRTLRAPGDPKVLVVSIDEARQLSTLRVVPPRLLRVTYDTASHALRNETPELGSIGTQILAPPVVYLNPNSPAGSAPTAWCATANFPSGRLRELAKINADGGSKWETFLDGKRTTYGPTAGTRKWKIDICPLPPGALPQLELLGFGLSA